MRTHARTYVRSVRMHVRTNVICLRFRVRTVHMHVRTHVRTVHTYVPTHAALFFPVKIKMSSAKILAKFLVSIRDFF